MGKRCKGENEDEIMREPPGHHREEGMASSPLGQAPPSVEEEEVGRA